MQIQRGDKIFQRGQIYQKFCSGGSKNFNKIEINYPGGPNILIYLDRGELKMGVQFLHDTPLNIGCLFSGDHAAFKDI